MNYSGMRGCGQGEGAVRQGSSLQMRIAGRLGLRWSGIGDVSRARKGSARCRGERHPRTAVPHREAMRLAGRRALPTSAPQAQAIRARRWTIPARIRARAVAMRGALPEHRVLRSRADRRRSAPPAHRVGWPGPVSCGRACAARRQTTRAGRTAGPMPLSHHRPRCPAGDCAPPR